MERWVVQNDRVNGWSNGNVKGNGAMKQMEQWNDGMIDGAIDQIK